MLKRYGASSKHRKATGAIQSSAIAVGGDKPETTHEEPVSIIENNKVTSVAQHHVVELPTTSSNYMARCRFIGGTICVAACA